ncbi:MAG: hypothetical protein EOM91_13680 [Sphingobacteriia bacterium]|nr:hypothetical protein [Sphingobacteriia bacterium]NCC38173.1 hypothetical protein [Gammaproteobacteria bacterium]
MDLSELITEITRLTGLHVPAGARTGLERHLESRMRALGLDSLADFLERLGPDHPQRGLELRELALLLTTGETFFMRDRGQMQLLRESLLPELLQGRSAHLTARIWSAACSSGEEAYSLAILLAELLPLGAPCPVEIHGTDVSLDALQRAAAGRYGDWSFRGCEASFRARWFEPHGDQWQLHEQARRMARFQVCDLLHDPLPDPRRGLAEMDLILCRNLFIYLQPEAIAAVTRKLVACLRPGGVLLTGHGELREIPHEILQVEVHPQSVVFRKRDPSLSGALGSAHPDESVDVPAWSARDLAGTNHRPPRRQRRHAPARHSVRGPSRAAAGARPGGMDEPGRAGLAARPLPRSQSSTTLEDESLNRAWRHADAGQFVEAQAICQTLLASDPMQPRAHLLASLLHMAREDIVAARESLRKALYLDPEMVSAYLHLEQIQSHADQTRAAEKTRAILRRLLREPS